MKGRARAAQQEYDLAVAQGWWGEAMARQKKLKGLGEYLPKDEDADPVQPEVILDAMLTMQAHGVPMKVEWVN